MENKELELERLLTELRNFALDNRDTKRKLRIGEDISKTKLDSVYDIDIFFSRKPGMRSSVQLVAIPDMENAKVSVMTAICSLIDTMVSRGIITNEDVFRIFSAFYTNKLAEKKGEK